MIINKHTVMSKLNLNHRTTRSILAYTYIWVNSCTIFGKQNILPTLIPQRFESKVTVPSPMMIPTKPLWLMPSPSEKASAARAAAAVRVAILTHWASLSIVRSDSSAFPMRKLPICHSHRKAKRLINKIVRVIQKCACNGSNWYLEKR